MIHHQEGYPGPRAPRERLLFAAVLVGAFLPRALLGAAVEGLRAELWLTDQALGTLVTAFAAAFAAGLLAPRAGAPWLRGPQLLGAGLLLCGAGTAAAALAHGFWSLVAARIAAGAGAGLSASRGAFTPASVVGPSSRRLLAGPATALAAGLLVGGASGAWPGWRGAFPAAGAALAALGLACLLARKGPTEAPPEPDGPAGAARRGEVGRWPALAGVALGTAGLSAALSWLPAFLERARGVMRPVAGLELAAALALCGPLGPALASTPLLHAGRAPSPAYRAAAGTAAAGLAAAGALWHASPLVYWPCLLASLLSAAAATSATLAWLGAGAERGGRPLLWAAIAGELSGAFAVGALADRAGFGRALLLIPAAFLAAAALLATAARNERG